VYHIVTAFCFDTAIVAHAAAKRKRAYKKRPESIGAFGITSYFLTQFRWNSFCDKHR
jgi:hypothetical protein